MNRTVSIIAAILLLASAGWWGWTRPDLLPGTDAPAPTERPEPRPDSAARPAAPPDTPEPAADPLPAPPPLAAAPVQTPAPRDAELPPETGSEMARETEAIAEAAIAAADARAAAEAAARAERLATEEARQELTAAIAEFMTPDGFQPTAIRSALAQEPAAANAAVGRIRDALSGQILTILDEAETEAAGRSGSASGDTAAPDSMPGDFDPQPYIDRIRRLL